MLKTKPFLGMALAWTLTACVQTGRVPQSTQENDHTEVYDPKEEWEKSDKRIVPGAFAPKIRLPYLYPTDKPADKGDKATSDEETVVVFWASWCKDCHEEMPLLIKLQHESTHIRWIDISLDSEASKAAQYIREHKMQGEHLFDGREWNGEASVDYAVPLHGIPYIIYIGKDGRIILTTGKANDLEEVLRK